MAAKRKRTLAKLTRPRLYNALQRKRLFRILDSARKAPVTWLAAPPGAGKTTLIASYQLNALQRQQVFSLVPWPSATFVQIPAQIHFKI